MRKTISAHASSSRRAEHPDRQREGREEEAHRDHGGHERRHLRLQPPAPGPDLHRTVARHARAEQPDRLHARNPLEARHPREYRHGSAAELESASSGGAVARRASEAARRAPVCAWIRKKVASRLSRCAGCGERHRAATGRGDERVGGAPREVEPAIALGGTRGDRAASIGPAPCAASTRDRRRPRSAASRRSSNSAASAVGGLGDARPAVRSEQADRPRGDAERSRRRQRRAESIARRTHASVCTPDDARARHLEAVERERHGAGRSPSPRATAADRRAGAGSSPGRSTTTVTTEPSSGRRDASHDDEGVDQPPPGDPRALPRRSPSRAAVRVARTAGGPGRRR